MAADPYRYYRIEARELVESLSKGVLELDGQPDSRAVCARLLRFAHTLKGASRVVKQEPVADAAHAFESALEPYRQAPGPIPRDVVATLLGHVDFIQAQLAQLAAPDPATTAVRRMDSPPPVSGAGASPARAAIAPPPVEEAFRTVRVDLDDMDALLSEVAALGVQAGALRAEVNRLGGARRVAGAIVDGLSVSEEPGRAAAPAEVRTRALAEELKALLASSGQSLGAALDRSEAAVVRLGERASTLRLVPVSAVFGALERAARHTAEARGKSVAFASSGGEHGVDGHVLGPLRDALLHLVRNAVDHGLESDEERRRAGKVVPGQVTIAVERRGQQVVFLCTDDGGGLDLAAIRGAAVRRGNGADQDAAALGAVATIELLLQGGLSTARELTAISGRGIGLDVVREAVAGVRGRLTVRSEPGKGTTFELTVPVSLSAIAALTVEAAGAISCIPLGAVRRALRVRDEDVARTGLTETLLYEGRALRLVWLAAILGGKGPRDLRSSFTVLIVEARTGWLAVAVDHVVGHTQVVVRPVPPLAGALPLVAGVILDAAGDPILLVDPDGLASAVAEGQGRRGEVESRSRPPILVVDDSLTTRMLEQSILESAGFEVSLATSGEEALERARERRYGLYVVDVEMPGMTGFDFVAMTRADPALSHAPAILVTSLGSPEFRRRGAEAGARAYIAKGEFEQDTFLSLVRGLVGE